MFGCYFKICHIFTIHFVLIEYGERFRLEIVLSGYFVLRLRRLTKDTVSHCNGMSMPVPRRLNPRQDFIHQACIRALQT